MQKIFNLLPYFLVLILWLYVLIPFLAPVAFKAGSLDLGVKINEIYEVFCHQRVERSLFLFGKDFTARFYSVEQLKELGAIDDVNPDPGRYEWPEYFGHGYYGNEKVGWKVPICIRDIALYGSLALTLLLLLVRRQFGKGNLHLPIWVLVALLLPMVFDGVAQTVLEVLQAKWVPDWFLHSISKRIITGVLFGFSLAIILFNLLFDEKSLTKGEKN